MTQTTFTDNVVVDGSQDVTQLTVEGHSTQTQALQTWQDSTQTPAAKLTGDGRLQVGDFEPAGTMATDDALIEAHRSDTSTKPKRGLHTLGRIGGAVSEALTWAVQELELLGSGGVSSLQTALRARIAHKNTGTSTTADLRAGDFETTNETGTTGARVGKATGARAAVRNLTGAFLEQAVGAEISIENTGTITDVYGVKIADMPSNVSGARYALYSGTGTAHFGDDLELPLLAATPAANPPANFAKLYTKLVTGEPHLFTKDASGVEREVSGSASFPNQNANVVFAGPASGAAAAPAFRALVANDIPALDAAKITSGVFNNARINWGAPSNIGTTTRPEAFFGKVTLNNSGHSTGMLNIYQAVDSGGLYINHNAAATNIPILYIGDTSVIFQISHQGLVNITSKDSITNSASSTLNLDHRTTGTPAAGFGHTINVSAQNSDGPGSTQAIIYIRWVDANTATRRPAMSIWLPDANGIREPLQMSTNGAAPTIGFLGASPVARPTVTGSRGGNVALQNLLTALANLGLITNSTTA